MKIPIEDVEAACDEWSETIRRDNWRHGTKDTIVFKIGGAFFQVVVNVHHEEGWQMGGELNAVPVRKVTKTVEVWEPEPSGESKGGE